MLRRRASLITFFTLMLAACSLYKARPTSAPLNELTALATVQVDTADTGRASSPAAVAEAVNGILISAHNELQPASLWQQLRPSFSLPEDDNDRIRSHREWYIDHPDYLHRITERAEPFAWYVHEEVHARGMPAEIVLLPIVESAYDPFAYSHGQAAGLWQFIPATGKTFGLEQNWWYDGRRDLVDSTAAALDYLKYLHDRFDGDWLLALAAYNSGEGTVSRAQRRNHNQGRPAGFWDLDLPRETREYVPKLLALKQLVAEPERYGIELKTLPTGPRFEVVDTEAQMDLAIAADLAEIDLEQLYRFNPGFNQWATAPGGPHRLLIPIEKAELFRQAIADLPPESRVQWIRHRIGRGETLSRIAKRYGTTVAALQEANDLNSASIRAGRYLLVPVASKAAQSYTLSARQRLHRTQNRSRSGERTEHVVGTGDTLWELSQTYDVSVRKLASWNGMAPRDTLRVGQKLVIWNRNPTGAVVHPGARARPVYYTVRRGDSLSRISNRFNVSVRDLRKWNELSRGAYLQPGQQLKVYVDVTKQTGV